jgi:N-methylhydantoinase A
VAAECGIRQVLVPREPGTLCARGMLLTDLTSDYVRSHFAEAAEDSWQQVLALFEAMERDAHTWLDAELVPSDRRRFRRIVDARYRGQNFEVKVECDGLGPGALASVADRFHQVHTREYGYAIEQRAIEFVSARVQAVGAVEKAPQAPIEGGVSLGSALSGRRPVYIDRHFGWAEARVYEREKLPVGTAFEGPAIVNEMSSTTVVLPGQSGIVDPWGNLIVRVAE